MNFYNPVDYHVHGVLQTSGEYAFNPTLQCYHCGYQQYIPPFRGPHELAIVRCTVKPGDVTWTLTYNHLTHTYQHLCPASYSHYPPNLDSRLMALEVAVNRLNDYLALLTNKDQEIERLRGIVELLQAQTKWLEQELEEARSGDNPAV